MSSLLQAFRGLAKTVGPDAEAQLAQLEADAERGRRAREVLTEALREPLDAESARQAIRRALNDTP